MFKIPKIYLSLLLAFITLSSCRFKSGGEKYNTTSADLVPVDGGLYIEASIGDASVLNPILATDSASNDINGQLYNGLVRYDKNINLIGDLAESWDISQGGKVITFHLRKNVTWHDGYPFTADDVKFTFDSLISSQTRTPFAADYLLVKKAEVLSPTTFRVTYGKAFAPAMESWGMGIIPKHIWSQGDINTNPALRKPIGTGPYIFKEWIPDEKIVLVSNPHYFRGKPHLDRYIYRIIPDMSVQFLELRQGTLSTMTPTPDQYNGYDDFFINYVKYKYPAFRYDYIAFNLKNPLFHDRRVRLALAKSVDKKEIIEGVYQDLAVAASGPFPPTSWAFNSNVSPIEFDQEGAKKLLSEAGWMDHDGDGWIDKEGNNFEFTLITNQGNKVRESMAQIVQNSLQKMGIKMNIRIIEWSVFIHKYIDERQFEAVLLAWNLSRDPDPTAIWDSHQTGKNQYNFVSYSNAEVDRLIEQGKSTFGIENRRPIYQRIHQLIAEDVPYLFLVNPMSLPVVHKKIMNVELAPAGIGWNFEDWYIPQRWQINTVWSS